VIDPSLQPPPCGGRQPVTGELANLAKAVTLPPIRAQKKAIDDHARPGHPLTNTKTLFAGITISADAVNPCDPLPCAKTPPPLPATCGLTQWS